MESHLEARLWNDIFSFSEETLGIEKGKIKATVLIETIPAAFEMDEILYELREHSSGLNCGRWDYIFSFIKKFNREPGFALPDRSKLTMDSGFLAPYVDLLIRTCHRRGAHAIGGMSAYIPVKGDDEANERAFEKVRQDKEREVRAGHDGTWVAHPGLVPVARSVFDKGMKEKNQLRESERGCQRCSKRITCCTKGQDNSGWPQHEHQRWHEIPGFLARRERQCAHLQPHGGHCHCRDLQGTVMAVGA